MDIKILGTRGEVEHSASFHSRHSGVLIDQTLLVDIGEPDYLDYDPKAIIITHLHPDHAYFVRSRSKSFSKDIPVYAPEKDENSKIEIIDSEKTITGYIIHPIPTHHSLKVKSQAYRIEKNSRKILYTGDMIWINKEYHRLFNGLDLVITEGSYLNYFLFRRIRMNDWLDKIPEKEKDKLKEKKQPDWTSPMLAKLTHDFFSDPDWIYERKLDGERCLAFITSGNVTLKSRNNKNIGVSYPEIVEALKNSSVMNAILDGEIVAFEGNQTSFAKLQNRMHVKSREEVKGLEKVYYYIFDTIYAGKYDLSFLPLKERKKITKQIINYKDPLRYLPHRNEKGLEYHKQACSKGWEGVIAKHGLSPYVHSRSSKWLKFKCIHEQELVIGGFTDPQGSRAGFGSLLLGYYQKNKLKYAGKVGTGFDDKSLVDLRKKMDDLEIKEKPFSQDEASGKRDHWIKPQLVAQIGFTEWTKDNKLRHPRFLGLRRDKDPKQVKKEA